MLYLVDLSLPNCCVSISSSFLLVHCFFFAVVSLLRYIPYINACLCIAHELRHLLPWALSPLGLLLSSSVVPSTCSRAGTLCSFETAIVFVGCSWFPFSDMLCHLKLPWQAGSEPNGSVCGLWVGLSIPPTLESWTAPLHRGRQCVFSVACVCWQVSLETPGWGESDPAIIVSGLFLAVFTYLFIHFN